jgi:hypothetical protein
MSRARSDKERAARIRDLRDRLLPDQTGSSLGQTLPEALLLLGDLVADFLAAEHLHQQAPCLHRYRGVVRAREVARRLRRYREAHAALEHATKNEA